MKRSTLPGGALAVLMAASLCAFTPALHALSPRNAQQAQQRTQQQSKTFVGMIMKLQNGQYALVQGKTSQGGLAGHFLDDQKDAQKYEGKKVKVTGTLDVAQNTIHVTNIQAA